MGEGMADCQSAALGGYSSLVKYLLEILGEFDDFDDFGGGFGDFGGDFGDVDGSISTHEVRGPGTPARGGSR